MRQTGERCGRCGGTVVEEHGEVSCFNCGWTPTLEGEEKEAVLRESRRGGRPSSGGQRERAKEWWNW